MFELLVLKTDDRVRIHVDDNGNIIGSVGVIPAGPLDRSLWYSHGQVNPELQLAQMLTQREHARLSPDRKQRKYQAALAAGLTELQARELSGYLGV